MSARSRPSWPERAYLVLLGLYPPAFRRRFGRDMADLFADRMRAERARGGAWRIAALWWHTMADLIGSASRERIAALHAWTIARIVPQPRLVLASTPGDPMLESVLYDLRLTVRALRQSPTFTVVAVVVIALGSGAVTTIFSAASAVILRPLPGVAAPGQLVNIGRTQASARGSLTPSYPFYVHVRDESRTLTGTAAWTMIQLTVSTGAEGTAAFGNLVSGNYFDVLGVRPAIGRFFAPDEDRTAGTHPVIVLGHGLWQRRFGGDSGVVGRTIAVNGSPFTVIGVAPPGFTGVYPVIRTDAWVPMMMAAQVGRDGKLLADAGSGWLELFGRLKDGVSIDQSRAELGTIATAHLPDEPVWMRAFTGIAMSRVSGFPADATGAVFGFIGLLLAVSALVLVIASVNVAGMLLARATVRRREMAVRIALGAGRGRLVRQLLTESVLLFGAGAAGGLVIAVWGTRLFGQIRLPAEVPIALDLAPDYRVLAFALGTALLTGVMFGLAPALEATRNDPSVSLRSDTAGSGVRRSRLRNGLVVGQMALSLVLLMSAGLFLRALDRGQRVNPGFDVDHVATASLNVNASGYADARARVFHDALKQRLLMAPGVTGVAYGRMLPLTNSSMGTAIAVDGYDPPAGTARRGEMGVNMGVVSPDYFTVLRMPLLRGRALLASDDEGAPRVAVVNEAFAKQFWPGADPIGRTFREDSARYTVVGVVRDAKYSSLNEDLRPFMYLAMAQRWHAATNLFVRTSGDAAALAPAIRDAMRAIDPIIPSPNTVTLEAATSVALLPQRVAAAVTGVMGTLGLILAAVGLYGVVAFTASQRTREIGVRMALGADRAHVLRMILGDGLRLMSAGMGIGMLLAVAATRVLVKFLFGVSPLDPLVLAVIPLGLAAVALVATYLPARRAASTDPLVALRAE